MAQVRYTWAMKTYALTPLGFDLYYIDNCSIGWAIELDHFFREQLLGYTDAYQFLLAYFNDPNVANDCKIEGIHTYESHPRHWAWDMCSHPKGFCQFCDIILIVHRGQLESNDETP